MSCHAVSYGAIVVVVFLGEKLRLTVPLVDTIIHASLLLPLLPPRPRHRYGMKGEELTMDYNATTTCETEYNKAVCLCGSQHCRQSFMQFVGSHNLHSILRSFGPLMLFRTLMQVSQYEIFYLQPCYPNPAVLEVTRRRLVVVLVLDLDLNLCGNFLSKCVRIAKPPTQHLPSPPSRAESQSRAN